MSYRLAIFDMDGTILDTLEDLTDAANYVLRCNNFPEHTIDEIRSYVGNGIAKLIDRAVPAECDEATKEKMLYQFMVYYKEHCADKTRPYDGICHVIKTLREHGIKTAVVSNKADAAVKELCVKYFDGLFDAAEGERAGLNKKPAPDLCHLVLEKLSVDAKDAVYIGDSDVDIETAKNAGLDEIIVPWGFRTRQFQIEHGAKRIIDTPDDITEIVI